MKTQISIRVDKLNYSQAIAVFNNKIVMHQGLPFDIQVPTKETGIALNELKVRDGKSFKSVDALFDDLDNR